MKAIVVASMSILCGVIGQQDFLSVAKNNICCLLPDWEAHMYLDYGTVFIDQNTAFAYINGSVHAAYSYTQKKVFFNVTGVEQSPLIPKPEPMNTLLLYDFSSRMSYMVSTDGECQKSGLDQNMTKYCIPDTAEKLSSGTFGTDKSVRPIHTYQYTTDVDVPFQITATIYDTGLEPVKLGTCLPVSVTFFTPSVNPDSGSLYNLRVLDLGPLQTEGIFDVPKQCL